MNPPTTTYYVIDRLQIAQSEKDSAIDRSMYGFEKDTSIYFSKEKLLVHNIQATKQAQHDGGHEGINKTFTLEQDDGVFALLIICFLLFARIFKGGFTFFKENAQLLLSSRQDINLFSETTVTEFWFSFILIFQTILLSAIILFGIFLESSEYKVPLHSLYTIILFMLTIGAFIVIKYSLYRFLGYLFDLRDPIKVWLRTCTIIVSMLGIIAFVPTLMIVYSQSYHQYLLVFFVALFIISQIILFYRIIAFFLHENVNFFFLIVYLCGVEIIPYIILYQVLIYLYKVDLISLLWL